MSKENTFNLSKDLHELLLKAGKVKKGKIFGILFDFLSELKLKARLTCIKQLIEYTSSQWAFSGGMPNMKNVNNVDYWANALEEFVAPKSTSYFLDHHSQKFTLSYLEKITSREQFAEISNEEHTDFCNYVDVKYHQLMNANPEEQEPDLRDELSRILAEVFSPLEAEERVKRDIWQVNHSKISVAIHNFVINNGYVPNITAIANACGLSRRTIYNHMGSLGESLHFKEHVKSFQVTMPMLMTKLYKLFMNEGDMKAGKLLFEIMGARKQQSQNQYIQINNLTITPKDIQMLPKNKRIDLEEYLLETFGSENRSFNFDENYIQNS